MECIIALRTNSGKVLVATNDDDEVMVCATRDDAIEIIEARPHWSAMLHQIIELEEL